MKEDSGRFLNAEGSMRTALPQLEDVNQMSEACDRLLATLKK
jgi:hypothetical protein